MYAFVCRCACRCLRVCVYVYAGVFEKKTLAVAIRLALLVAQRIGFTTRYFHLFNLYFFYFSVHTSKKQFERSKKASVLSFHQFSVQSIYRFQKRMTDRVEPWQRSP